MTRSNRVVVVAIAGAVSALALGFAEANAFWPGGAGIDAIRPFNSQTAGELHRTRRVMNRLALALNAEPGGTVRQDLDLPDLPEAVTSFGGAILNDALYVYGGHTGYAHSYSTAEQGNTLLRLNLREAGEWESLAGGPKLQGLALVAHGGKLYRLGGFTAKNAEGEDHDLWSQNSAAAFDPATGKWNDMPALPEPRSSFDAAVLGEAIYVIGGWSLQGPAENQWHTTAWRLDFGQERQNWQPLPSPPFQRRALAAAAHADKLYVIGGMQEQGGPTTRVAVFDPQAGEWSEGPPLVGEQGMTGFGASAFATGGNLYVSTFSGELQRLAPDGSRWEVVRKLPTARFFHRMLPVDDQRLLVVGGASMQSGKFPELEIIELGAKPQP